MASRLSSATYLPEAPRRRPRRRFSGRVLRFIGWLIVAGLAGLAVLRGAHSDSSWLVVAAISVSPWLYFLAWIVAAAAAVGRRWALATAASVLVVVSVVWLAPQWDPWARAAAAPPGAVPLRLFDANVQYSNPSLASIAGEIRADHPDLVTLEEISDSNLGSLLASGAVSRYRWHYIVPDHDGGEGFGVWSDVPMTGAETWWAADHPDVRAWLAPAGAPRVRLYVIHTTAPRSAGSTSGWHHELAIIAETLRAEPHPLLVAGDFNATWDMYEFQGVLHAGLRDAAVEAGKGWEMTWSRQVRVIPPVIRIDHILYSSGMTVTGYRTGLGRGSDHHPIEAQLAVTPS